MKRGLVALAALVVLCACSKRDPAPAPAADDQAGIGRDKTKLARLVDADVKVSKAMRDADDASKTGDAGAAVTIAETRALPAADEGLALANGAPMQMETPWGATERDALAALLRDRKAAIPKYVEAVKSNDAEKMLGSVQAQAVLERRAIKTAAEIEEKR